ncbi:MAG TPA: hypothetical protein VHC90_13510 [Bryobacteraceae bacterium]|nr:hypothetical protein [Bryobacteraceae bacterium]
MNAEICSACCGAGREETIDCPLTCEYLAEAHKYEKKPERDPKLTPGADIDLTDDFLHAHEFVIVLLGSAMSEAIRRFSNATDADAVDALEHLAKTWRTMDSGLVYESAPVNPIALGMFDAVKKRVEELRERIRDSGAEATLPDKTILGVIVFLQRVAFGLNNGRSRCKAFLDFLSQFYVDMKQEEAEAEAEEEPRVIL